MADILNFKKNTVAKVLNNRTYTDFYNRLSLLARSVFKWENLPNGINEKWIEKYLFNEGVCMFFKDEEKGFMIARTAPFGTLNEYDEPTKLFPVFNNSCGGQTTKAYKNNVDAVLICIFYDGGTFFHGQSQLAGAHGQNAEACDADFNACVA